MTVFCASTMSGVRAAALIALCASTAGEQSVQVTPRPMACARLRLRDSSCAARVSPFPVWDSPLSAPVRAIDSPPCARLSRRCPWKTRC